MKGPETRSIGKKDRAVDGTVSTIQHVLFLRRVDAETNVHRFCASLDFVIAPLKWVRLAVDKANAQ